MGLQRADPIFRLTIEHARDEGGQAHRFEHVLIVGRRGTVRPDANRNASGDRRPHVGDAVAETQIGTRVMRDRAAAGGDQFDLIGVDPDRVRRAEPATSTPIWSR